MRYLIIFEDGSLTRSSELNITDYDSACDGYVTLVDMLHAKEWFPETGEWELIKEATINKK